MATNPFALAGNSLLGAVGGLLGGGAPARTGAPRTAAPRTAARPATPARPGMVAQPQQQLPPQLLQLMQMFGMGPSQPAQPQGYAPFDPSYGALLGAGALNAQNNAMSQAVAQGNNAVVSGGLRSVSSPSGTSIQNPGLYQAAMARTPAGGNTGARFDNQLGSLATSMGFGTSDDPAFRAALAARQSATQAPVAAPAASGAGTAPAANGHPGTAAAGTGASGGAAGAMTPVGALAQNFITDMQAERDAARAATEARDVKGQTEIAAQTARNQETLKRLGQQQAADINRGAFAAQAKDLQNNVARGLANTSVGAANSRAIERERGAQQMRLGDTLARTRMDVENQDSQRSTDWTFARNDIPPSLSDIANMMGVLGEYGTPPKELGDLGIGSLFDGLGSLLNGLGGGLGAGLGGYNPATMGPFQQGGGMFSVPSERAQKRQAAAQQPQASSSNLPMGLNREPTSMAGLGALAPLLGAFAGPAASGIAQGASGLVSRPGQTINQGLSGLSSLLSSGITGLSSLMGNASSGLGGLNAIASMPGGEQTFLNSLMSYLPSLPAGNANSFGQLLGGLLR